MKKTIIAIAFFAVLLLTVSARTEREYQAAEGFKAPFFTVQDNLNGKVSLSELRGRYVLVNFWSSADAESRVATRSYSRMMETISEDSVTLVSVNLDRNERLFREIVRIDHMNPEMQFHVCDAEADALKQTYGLEFKMQSFLLDKEGTIVAVNPTQGEIESLIASL